MLSVLVNLDSRTLERASTHFSRRIAASAFFRSAEGSIRLQMLRRPCLSAYLHSFACVEDGGSIVPSVS